MLGLTGGSLCRLCLWVGCCVVLTTATQPYLRRVRRHIHVTTDETPTDEDTSNSTQEWFTQRLDHFNQSDNTEWLQRYWVNVDHYSTGAPVFLYVSGEWEETGFSEGLYEPWEQHARRHNGLLFKLEHRFYGESQPTGGNMTVEDLQYLSSDHALEDLASFIKAMGKVYDLPKGTKWIAFGCSYGASLATWLRYKYPDLVYAAVASSAPLLVKVSFPEYYNAVGEALIKFYSNVTHNNTMGRKCLEAVKQANKQVYMIIQTPEGLNSTLEKFGLDEVIDIDPSEDIRSASADVFNALFTEMATAVQDNNYNDETETWGIERFCDTLLNETIADVVDRYAEIYKLIRSEDDPKENETNLQWNYQTCSEFGFFQVSESDNSIFGNYIPEDAFFEDCKEQFGERFTEDYIRQRVDRTNTKYGGLELNATRVLHIQGSLDPWFPLGLNHTRNPLSPVIVIEGGSHCSDVKPESDSDSDALRDARKEIFVKITEWLLPVTWKIRIK